MAGNEGDRDLVDPSRTGAISAPPDDAEVERAIASVPGVTSASLRRDPASGRTRLRLRLRAGEDAEQAAWSIAATLRERFGIALDPASIRPVSASEQSEHEVSEALDEAGPAPTAPASADTAPTAPASADTAPTAPASADPVPAEPASADPVPTAPASADPVPTAWVASGPAPDADAEAASSTGEPDGRTAPPPPSPVLALTPPPAPEVTATPEPGHDTGDADGPGPESVPAPEPAPGTARRREPAATIGASQAGGRATIHRLDIERGAREVRATVALLRGEQAAHGVARAVPTTRSILRAIAEATASALQQFMTAPLLIGIDRIEVEPAADPAHVLVAVTILADRGEEQLLGVSLVRGDAERAVVRATLDALNRRVSPFLVGEPGSDPEREAAAAS